MDGGVICQQAIHRLDANWILGPAKVFTEMGNQVNGLKLKTQWWES